MKRLIHQPYNARIKCFYSTKHLAIQRRLLSDNYNTDSSVRIVEVGPRDGLQNIKQTVPTAVKIDLIQQLASTGLRNIEATSFVSPKWIPQLADGREVFHSVLGLAQQQNPINLPVLVPNLKGLKSALECSAQEIVVFASASEGFSQRNTNCSIEEALINAEKVTQEALQKGIKVRGVVSCVISCPYDGPTKPDKVLHIVKKLLDMGCYEVGLGDTLGVGTPLEIKDLLQVLLTEIPANKLAGHFHDTYGQAVANVVKAYEMGLRTFDSSIAGLGGCPYAKGAKGNLATEDLAYLFKQSGIETGIDLAKLVSVGEWISRYLNQPNSSRAGSALFAKKDIKPVVPTSTPAPAIVSDTNWVLQEDKGEYNVCRNGNAVKITLTRPKNGNALTTLMVEQLTNLFNKLSEDTSVFHIFLAAEGKYFCTGMDLSSSGSSSSNDASVKADYYEKVVGLFHAIDKTPQTTIAVVNGPCYGGGVGLAFVCDIRLATKSAKFTMTEIKLGLSPAIISKYMIREWGISFLREAVLTGREVDPTELHRIGAIHGLAETEHLLLERMESYRQKLALCAPQMAAVCKDLVKLGWVDAGGEQQEEKIKHTFEIMMAPGSEGSYGLAKFRAKVKNIDWGNFWSEQHAKPFL